MAPKEILEKRVIRTAKRRSSMMNNEEHKSAFSGFGGFNKTQKTSFDFLANLTNGAKTSSTLTNQEGSPSLFPPKQFTGQSSGLFSTSKMSKPVPSLFEKPMLTTNTLTTSPVTETITDSKFNDSPFKIQATSSLFEKPTLTTNSTLTKSPVTETITDSKFNDSPFKIQATSSLFEKPTLTTTSTLTKSPVTETKTDSKLNDSPFKIQATSTPINSFSFAAKPSSSSDPSSSSAPHSTNNLFGGQAQNVFAKNSFKMSSNPAAIPTSPSKNDKSVMKKDISDKKESDGDKDKIDDKKIKYYTHLKGLNISVSQWIQKHVEETPLCILTPIFKDYEKHLKVIQDEYFNSEEAKPNGEKGDYKQNLNNDSKLSSVSPKLNVFPNKDATSINNSPEQKKTNTFSFGISTSSNTPTKSPGPVGFTFGNISKAQSPTNSSNTAQAPKVSTGFTFGTTSSSSSIVPTTTSSSAFSFGINTAPQTSSSFPKATVSPFSFGTGKPFSFNSNIQKKDEETSTKEDEDEPPKVEYTPLVEENSVYDKKCKIFVKKDGNFVDKGVGTLYIKKIVESGKHQLLVRANTTLGNVLLNLVLGSSIPTQRTGKNNVMLVCIATPDAKPPPTPVLIRVKTSEEADELLETLNKYKM